MIFPSRWTLLVVMSLACAQAVWPQHAGAAASKANAQRTLPEGALRLQKAEVMDRHGFGRPMTAVSLFIPAGWQPSGGIVWEANNSGCGKNGTRFEWRAVSPDGVSAIEILSEETWGGNNLNLGLQTACPNVTTNNVKDFLAWYVQRNRPRSRILDYRERPDYTEKLRQFNKSEAFMAGEMRTWIEGGEVLVAYDLNGRDMRETLGLVVMFNLNRMPGVYPGEIREFLTISTLPGLAMRAPHGQLDFKLTESIRRTIQTDPQWSAEMAQHNQKMSGIAMKGAADRHRITMETNREIAAIRQQTYDSQQASQDRIHENFSQMIRGVDTYVDTTSKERIELPNTHNNVWRLNDDTYILTDDVNFEPYRDLGVEGRQLEVAK